MPERSGSRRARRSVAGPGSIVIRRLHRLVRAGYVPLLGYASAEGEDQTVRLHRRGRTVTLSADGSAVFDPADGPARIEGEDSAGFDALFPPDRPNRRNIVRRLYEMGVGS